MSYKTHVCSVWTEVKCSVSTLAKSHHLTVTWKRGFTEEVSFELIIIEK